MTLPKDIFDERSATIHSWEMIAMVAATHIESIMPYAEVGTGALA
jgi:hypothetical protein